MAIRNKGWIIWLPQSLSDYHRVIELEETWRDDLIQKVKSINVRENVDLYKFQAAKDVCAALTIKHFKMCFRENFISNKKHFLTYIFYEPCIFSNYTIYHYWMQTYLVNCTLHIFHKKLRSNLSNLGTSYLGNLGKYLSKFAQPWYKQSCSSCKNHFLNHWTISQAKIKTCAR